mmetsp:Transcript_35925/g.91830  ORF Transcript_35925/g.91830 Transcript_35925/m.91830 type:complete len:271 (+) Transcript_35925:231-1043(+)
MLPLPRMEACLSCAPPTEETTSRGDSRVVGNRHNDWLLLRAGRLGGEKAVEYHAKDCHAGAAHLLHRVRVLQDDPAPEQHEHCLHVPQHLEGDRGEAPQAEELRNVHEDGREARGRQEAQRRHVVLVLVDPDAGDQLVEEGADQQQHYPLQGRGLCQQVVGADAKLALQGAAENLLQRAAHHRHGRPHETHVVHLHVGDRDDAHAKEHHRHGQQHGDGEGRAAEDDHLQKARGGDDQQLGHLVRADCVDHEAHVEADDGGAGGQNKQEEL